mgnify:CR=1 FL=1
MISAGQTSLPCGTRIKVIKSDDVDLLNLTGVVTHPFQGLIWPNTKYVIGVRLDEKHQGIFSGNIVNLTQSDIFTPVFCDFDSEHYTYYIEGEDLLAERIGKSTLYAIGRQYGGIYDNKLNKLVFSIQESCLKCVDEIEKSFSAILY